MKITLKTLQRETFDIDIDEELKVSDLKAKVAETKGAGYAAPTLKLIYAGKILNDESQLKEYNISTFVVVMISKPKPAPVSAAAPAASTTPAPAVETPAAPTPAAPTPATTAPPAAPAAAPEETGTGDSMFVAGSAYHSAVTEMISMGFERDQIERAMHASFMNPHRAIEYLCNPSSMPAVPPPQAAQPAGGAPVAAAPAATPPAATTPAATTPAAGGDQARNLEFLRNQPQFQMLRQMVSQDPQMLQSLLVQLGQANPQLLQAIQENPQQFISLLNEAEGGGAPGAPGAEGGPPPGSVEISLSPTEKEAIDRIKALGFPEHLVIQAYFACEKNENLAAEFLFSESYDNDSWNFCCNLFELQDFFRISQTNILH